MEELAQRVAVLETPLAVHGWILKTIGGAVVVGLLSVAGAAIRKVMRQKTP